MSEGNIYYEVQLIVDPWALLPLNSVIICLLFGTSNVFVVQ